MGVPHRRGRPIQAYWYDSPNVGDTLTPILLHYLFGESVERVETNDEMKLLGVGSILTELRRKDTVWGTGAIRHYDTFPAAPSCTFLAVRGPLTREILLACGGDVPEVYGDPGLLLPRIYSPNIQPSYRLGIIPHWVDRKEVITTWPPPPGARYIDVERPWREFIDDLLSCERIVTSSLHGIVLAEAYGRPATWVEYGDNVIGRGFKFRDYLAGTYRGHITNPGELPLPPKEDLDRIADRLEKAYRDWRKS